MKFQNYQTHLKTKHPHADHKNLRGKANNSIKNMFVKKQAIKRASPSDSEFEVENKRFSPNSVEDCDQNHNSAKAQSPLDSLPLVETIISGVSLAQSPADGDLRGVPLGVGLLDGEPSSSSEDFNPAKDLSSSLLLVEASTTNPAGVLHDVPLEGDLLDGEPSGSKRNSDQSQANHDIGRDNVTASGKKDVSKDDNEKASIEALNNLIVKLAPLARLEGETIAKLADNIENLAKLSISPQEDKNKPKSKKVDTTKTEDFDLTTLFFSCHSVADITTKFQEFVYNAVVGGFVCCVCTSPESVLKSGVFTYECELENDFPDQVQSKKFGNLKNNLKRHLKTLTHTKALEVATIKANIENKEDKRNIAVALKICRIAYFLLKAGRPDTDFTTLIYLHSVNGCDVGDINHSYRFPPQFLKHVAKVIQDHLKRFLDTRLTQTGHKPPAKVVADKATWQHQTRQLIGIVTVVPDADQPLQAMILGTPVVKLHTGRGVTENITNVTDKFITAAQFRGGSFDGQYFHLGVDKQLDAHYDVNAHYDVDPMHRAGTVDLHLRKEKSSTWINAMTAQIGKAFKIVNYGKLFEHFFEVCQELTELGYDVHFKFPRFFSETKFANYVRLVYCSFREDYPGLVRTFNEVVDRLKLGTSEDRNKAKEISNIQGKILNLKFVLQLSGSCDIYNRFGHGINILQTVNMLPHTKFDQFVDVVTSGLSSMADTVDPKLCPCDQNVNSDKCLWPLLHKDLREVATKLTYRGVTIGNLMANELSTRAGERRTKENMLLDQAGVTQKCFEELKKYSRSLGSNLFAKVYDAEDKKLINTIRILLDLETLAIKLKLSGSAHVAALQSKLFIEKSREISPQLSDISDQELRMQYRDFLRKLEAYVDDTDEDDLKSMNIFKSFLSTGHKLFLNVELVVQILCDAATSMSVESVVESWVSIYETHSNKHRPISNDRAEEEICVAVNGPLLQHSDLILKAALKEMYKDSKDVRNRWGKFIRRNNNIVDYAVSKSVDSLLNMPNSKPFMSS